MTDPPSSDLGGTAVPALKRVKAAEVEWDGRLRASREEAEATVQAARAEADAAVKAAVAENEAARTRALERARVQAEREANDLLAEGQKAAAAAAAGVGKRPADHRDEILDAVLGSTGPA